MKVYVVMCNDYPDCVFSTERAAEAYCRKLNNENAAQRNLDLHVPRLYRRVYEFTVAE